MKGRCILCSCPVGVRLDGWKNKSHIRRVRLSSRLVALSPPPYLSHREGCRRCKAYGRNYANCAPRFSTDTACRLSNDLESLDIHEPRRPPELDRTLSYNELLHSNVFLSPFRHVRCTKCRKALHQRCARWTHSRRGVGGTWRHAQSRLPSFNTPTLYATFGPAE